MSDNIDIEIKTLEQMFKLKGLINDDAIIQTTIKNASDVMLYGADIQSKIANLPQTLVNSLGKHDIGEIGILLEKLIECLSDFEIKERKKFIFFSIPKNELVKELLGKYLKIENKIKITEQSLSEMKLKLYHNVVSLEQAFVDSTKLIQEISMYITVGNQKLGDLMKKSTDENDLVEKMKRRIEDLELTKTIALQTMAYIQMLKKKDRVIFEQTEESLNQSIRIWRKNVVLLLGNEYENNILEHKEMIVNNNNEMIFSISKIINEYNSDESRTEIEKKISEL